MKRLLAILLTFVICVTSSISVNAEENQDGYSILVDISMTSEEALRLGYDNLSEEAKAIFNTIMQLDSEMYSYHKTNVDSNLKLTYSPDLSLMSTTDALSIVSEGLQTLNLPAAVREALAMLSSGISAAFADGPLVWGDIYLIAVTLYVAVVVAEHWDEVKLVWDDVINIFKQAYSEISSEITTAFNNITTDIDSEINIPSVAPVQVNDKDMRINGVLYRCTAVIPDFTPENTKFYPAVISNNKLWACPTNVSFKLARIIMNANIKFSGVLTYRSGPAKAICGDAYVPHPSHEEHSSFYLPHYHKANTYGNPLNTHAWYVIN